MRLFRQACRVFLVGAMTLVLAGTACWDALGKNRCQRDEDCLGPRVCATDGVCRMPEAVDPSDASGPVNSTSTSRSSSSSWDGDAAGSQDGASAQDGSTPVDAGAILDGGVDLDAAGMEDASAQVPCELRERVVLAMQPRPGKVTEPAVVLRLVGRTVQRVLPTDYAPDSGVVERPGSVEPVNPMMVQVTPGRIWLMDSYGFYTLDSTTLLQADIRSGELELAERYPASFALHDNQLVYSDTQGLMCFDLGRPFAAAQKLMQIGDLPMHTFTHAGVWHLVLANPFFYTVLEWQAGGQVKEVARVSESDRFGVYSIEKPRALWFDATVGALLLTTSSGLTFPRADNAWALPPLEEDWVRPYEGVGYVDHVQQVSSRTGMMAAAGGSFVGLADLTDLPPVTRRATQWPNTYYTCQGIALGCRNVVVAYPNDVLWLDLDTLRTVASMHLDHDVKDMVLVDKDVLGITGDE